MNENKFTIKSDYTPKGDQPEAIKKLADGIKEGKHHQILQGVTGSGKTFTMANIIQDIQRPTLVLAHNKTLAYQLFTGFKEFFLIMLLNILFLIMIITNQKLMLLQLIPILQKIHQ